MIVLDGFCGAGGIAVGLHRAGWRVVGVDHEPQPDYPFEFVQADAVEFTREHGHKFDLRHGSPPCQHHSALTKGTNLGRTYPDLVDAWRQAALHAGGPYVLENVAGAPIRKDLMLCGEMFGLRVIRHRYFELHQVTVPQPAHVPHRGRVTGWRHGVRYDGPYFAVHGDGGGKGTVREWQDAMGIHWTDRRKSIAEAIPPAYAELIGRHALQGR